MTKPDPGKPHQLLSTNRKRSRQLNFFDQQTVEEPEDQNCEDPETELKQAELQAEP